MTPNDKNRRKLCGKLQNLEGRKKMTYKIKKNKKELKWVKWESKDVLIWSFVPNEEIEKDLLWPIESRLIGVVTKLENTDGLKEEKRKQFPFRGKFFRVFDQASPEGVGWGYRPDYLVVTKDGCYRFHEEFWRITKTKKIEPELTATEVCVRVCDILLHPGSRYADQLGVTHGTCKFVKISQNLNIAELRLKCE